MPDIQRARRITTYFTLAILVCCAFSCGNKTKDALEQAEQRVRAAGQPVTLEELNAYYPEVPREQNAALVYEEAFKQFNAADGAGVRTDELLDRLELVIGEVPAGLKTEIEDHLVACAAVFATLDRAATHSQSRYAIDLRNGAATRIPHLRKLRACARLEALRGTAQLLDGDFDGLIHSQANTLKIAKLLENEPLMASQLVRIAINSIASESLARDLGSTAFPGEILASLTAIYAPTENPDNLVRAYIGDRCCMADLAFRMRMGEFDDEWPDWLKPTLKSFQESGVRLGVTRHALSERLAMFEQLAPFAAASALEWPERVALGEQVQRSSKSLPKSNAAVKLLLPTLAGGVRAFAREAAILRMTLTALAVEQYWAETGELPSSILDLVPKHLSAPYEDPFDGQPLRYKRLSKGYKLYSVYIDLADDGGAFPRKTESGFIGDWAFQVRR